MKKVFRIIFLCGVFIFTAFSCEKEMDEELSFEISTDSINPIIQTEIENIEFKFYLSNENSEEATIFIEGENFIFNFIIINKNEFDVVIDSEFINENFFRVYKSTGDQINVGRPWTGLFCEYSQLPTEFNLAPNEVLTLSCPWIINPEENNKEFYPFCFSEQNDFIAKGKYFTKLNFNLIYSSTEDSYKIEDLLFKINFEVK